MNAQNFGNHAETGNCPIWPDFRATRNYMVADGDDEEDEYSIDSPRAGGFYFITPEAVAKLEEKFTIRLLNDPRPGTPRLKISNYDRLRLTTWLLDQWSLTDMEPFVTSEVITSIRHIRRLPVHERANRLLRLCSQETHLVGDNIVFSFREGEWRTHEPTLMALAWSESERVSEVEYLIEYLEKNGWLQCRRDTGRQRIACAVTVDGYTEIARQPATAESDQAFVAMWFDDSMKDAYWQGIEPAIRAAGYEPVLISNVEHTGLIDDAIIAAIRKAKFVIADLTQGDDGARGGVYYEAGFAHGLDLKVIFTCRKDKFNLVHFDANHQAHILWDGYEDLKTRLHRRIEAVVGRGPLESYEENSTSNDAESTH